VVGEEALELLPVVGVVPDAFAVAADRDEALERGDGT